MSCRISFPVKDASPKGDLMPKINRTGLRRAVIGWGWLLSVFFWSATGQAQTTVVKGVIGSGGAETVSPSFQVRSTVGQIIAGSTASAHNTARLGYWYEPILVLTPVLEGDPPPATFRLHQNYPNPFNPLTHIRFHLPKQCRVRLSVFDVQGHRVAQLVDAELPAGKHEVLFNPVELGSGVYFYRIRAGLNEATRKLMLVK
jgi:hypothetical protein